eukprot:6176561-Pleurochrysis_carterae.AAC.4
MRWRAGATEGVGRQAVVARDERVGAAAVLRLPRLPRRGPPRRRRRHLSAQTVVARAPKALAQLVARAPDPHIAAAAGIVAAAIAAATAAAVALAVRIRSHAVQPLRARAAVARALVLLFVQLAVLQL